MIVSLPWELAQATVREDYSGNGDAWTSFPHDHARSRAYRWGEDGIGGISDNHQRLCFSLALWNGKDPILKERLFGVTGHQGELRLANSPQKKPPGVEGCVSNAGNHGEDVKELYYYLDSTPTHSYMKYLYKYPQKPYPYEQLIRESGQRSRDIVEFEITDTDAFEEDRYWDIFIEVHLNVETAGHGFRLISFYAKMKYAKDEDNVDGMSIRITAYNRGPEAADLHIIPQLWFRNTWSWPKDRPTGKEMPSIRAKSDTTVQIDHATLGRMYCHLNESPGPIEPMRRGSRVDGNQPVLVEESVSPELLFTDNETNVFKLYGGQNRTSYVKDAFHDHIILAHRPSLPESEQPEGEHIAPIEKEGNEALKSVATAHSGSEAEHLDKVDRSRPHTIPDIPQPIMKIQPQPPTPKWPYFVNPERQGTKFGANYVFKQVPPNGGCCVVRLKLTNKDENEDEACYDEEMFDEVIQERRLDADEFYSRFNSGALSDDLRNVMRQALGGMLW